jgi:phage-related protein
MAVDVFVWPARVGDQGTVTFNVLSAAFGDGYSQEAGNGINNRSESWPYTFVGTADEVAPITAFLDAHAGFRGFQWTPPFGQPGIYKCTAYKITPTGGPRVQLNATFEQKFAP